MRSRAKWLINESMKAKYVPIYYWVEKENSSNNIRSKERGLKFQYNEPITKLTAKKIMKESKKQWDEEKRGGEEDDEAD